MPHSSKFQTLAKFACLALSLLSCQDKGGYGGQRLLTFVRVDSGDQHNCGLRSDNSLVCWGLNDQGQLGLGDVNNRGDTLNDFDHGLSSVNLGTNQRATQVVGGTGFTCARLTDGQVKCWGSNTYGQLGLGDTLSRGDTVGSMGDALATVSLGTGRTAVELASGAYHVCARLDDGSVKCWGNNTNGALGRDNTANLGTGSNQMGDNLTAINLGAGRTAKSLTCGTAFSCALLDDGHAKCWGQNSSGQLGQGDTTNWGSMSGQMAALAEIDLGAGHTVLSLAAGLAHVCAVLEDGSVKCWGANANGQLGLGDTATRGDAASEMGSNLMSVNLGTGRTAKAVYARGYRSCALLDNAQLKCWGGGFYGELGQGNANDLGSAAGQMGDNLSAIDFGTGHSVLALSLGLYHSCVRLDDGTVKCWGRNDSAQLGLGDTIPRGAQSGQMGDALKALDAGRP